MTTQQLLRWQRMHARRQARARGITTSPLVFAIATAVALFVLVAWRSRSDVTGASQAWLYATIAMFAVVFLRVPAHLYWRTDGALLAQLPIGGRALFDVAVLRCVTSAAVATMIAVIGAAPLLALDADRVGAATRALAAMPIAGDPVPRLTPVWYVLRHAALAGVLGIVAAALLPAVAIGAASLVATGRGQRALRAATVMTGAGADQREPHAAAPPPTSDAALLGAMPGAAASVAIVVILLASPWVQNRDAPIPALIAFAAIAVISIGFLVVIRPIGANAMPAILREMASLDRQQLATLELNPPTAIERGIASLLGESGIPFRKDARLMRRRYPMAFALGALTFAMLTTIGFAQPDSTLWFSTIVAAATAYGAALAGRLWRPPVELALLSATLPISSAARARAKLAWLASWMLLFVGLPATFVCLRGM